MESIYKSDAILNRLELRYDYTRVHTTKYTQLSYNLTMNDDCNYKDTASQAYIL